MRRLRNAVVIGAVGATLVGGALFGQAAGAAKAKQEPVLALDSAFGTGGIATTPLSATEADRFLAVATQGPNTFTAGLVTTGGDQAMAVTKLDAKGAKVASFGTGGTAMVNVAVGGKLAEIGRGIAMQRDGKIVVSGPIEHDVTATGDAAKDTDIAVIRFKADGQLDPNFGTAGIAKFDLGTGVAVNETTYRADTAWNVVVADDASLFVQAATPSKVAGRTDTDIQVLKLKPNGSLDPTFAEAGKLTIDGNAGGLDSPRGLIILPNGMVVTAGYSADATGIVTPLITRFNQNGKFDKKFGVGGILPQTRFLQSIAESYDVSPQGNKLVFAGYGADVFGDKVDLYSARLNADGTWDKTYGTTDGIFRVDIAKDDDRARDITVLPNGQVFMVGSGKLTPTALDGLMVLLTKDGQAVTAFGTNGAMLQDLGGINDAFFGTTVAEDGSVLVAGYVGQATGGNDDAVVLRLTASKP